MSVADSIRICICLLKTLTGWLHQHTDLRLTFIYLLYFALIHLICCLPTMFIFVLLLLSKSECLKCKYKCAFLCLIHIKFSYEKNCRNIWCKTFMVMRIVPSVIQEAHTKRNRMTWKEVGCDPGSNLLVGQCSAEMLLDVGLQHCVEVLKLSVSDQTYDVYLADRRKKQRDGVGTCLHCSRHLQGR